MSNNILKHIKVLQTILSYVNVQLGIISFIMVLLKIFKCAFINAIKIEGKYYIVYIAICCILMTNTIV